MKTKKYKKQKTKTKRRKIKKGGNTPSYLANVMKNPLYLTPTSIRNTQTRTKSKSKSNSNNDCTVMNISRPTKWKWKNQTEVFKVNVETYKGEVNSNDVPDGYGYLTNDDKIKLYQGYWDNGVARNCPSLKWTPMTRKNINKRINEVLKTTNLKTTKVKKGPALRQGAKRTLPSLSKSLII